VREARTLDLRITRFSYETYALANCATTPLMSLREITSNFNLSTRERRPATNTATVMSEGHEIISSYETFFLAINDRCSAVSFSKDIANGVTEGASLACSLKQWTIAAGPLLE
jgi:hypothetical protein